MRSGAWTAGEQTRRDLRFGVRSMRRAPVASAVAVLSVALGIGANTAIFSMLYAVAWRPLAVSHPESLVQLRAVDPGTGRAIDLPVPVLRELRRRQIFAGIVFDSSDGIAARIGDRTDRVIAEVVTGDFFSVLGVRMAAGHDFPADADGIGWTPSAILSYDFFSRRFNADPAIVGQSIYLNGYAFSITGVSPPGFSGLNVGQSPDVRLPMMLEAGMQARRMPALALLDRSARGVGPAVARLRPGSDRRQVEAAAQAAVRQLWPASTNPAQGAPLIRLVDGSRGRLATPAWLTRVLTATIAGTGLLLLIACLNVANLSFARAAARRREFGVRLALGASRSSLIRQLLTESVLVLGCAAALGWLMARWAVRLLVSWLPHSSTPIVFAVDPDWRVLLFTAVVTIATGLLFGIAPAISASRVDPIVSLKGTTTDAAIGGRRDFRSRASVVAQVALTLVLLTVAGAFAGAVHGIQARDPGYDGSRVLLFSIKPVRDGQVRYTDVEVRRLLRELVRRAAELPGIVDAAMSGSGEASGVPGTAVRRGDRTVIQLEDGSTSRVEALADEVSPSFFRMFDLPALSGRTFTDADDERGGRVVVITDALARDLFGTSSPLGRRIRLGQGPDAAAHEVVGVVSGRRFDSRERQGSGAYFQPLAQERVPVMPTLVVKVHSADAPAAIRDIRRLCAELDPNLPVFNIRDAGTQQGRALAQERLAARLFAAFGVLGLLLATIGVYGVIACDVARRVTGIAVRLSIGADSRSVVRMVLGDSLRLVLVGVVVGLPVAYAAARLAATSLRLSFDLPFVLFVTVLIVMAVGAVSGWLPARRAARVDPVSVLRAQ